MTRLTTTGRLRGLKPEMKFGFLIDDNGGPDIFIPGNVLGKATFDSIFGKKLSIEYQLQDNGRGPIAINIDYIETAPNAPIIKSKIVPYDNQKSLTFYGIKPGQLLTKWAFIALSDFRGTPSVLPELARMALKENWSFGEDGSNPYSILHNYIRYTFYKIWKQDKILYSIDGNSALFNTGLVDDRYEPIDALFERTPDSLHYIKQPYVFKSFCVFGKQKVGKQILRDFQSRSKRAKYFDSLSQLLFDHEAEMGIEWDHIINDGIARGRYPVSFLQRNLPRGFEWSNEEYAKAKADPSFGNHPIVYLERYVEALENDQTVYMRAKSEITYAIDLAKMRCDWNFKTAIPFYFPTEDKMSLILPLSFSSDSEPDLALVVSKENSANYQAHTVLTLDQAYNGARLVSRPMSDWLSPQHIKQTGKLEPSGSE